MIFTSSLYNGKTDLTMSKNSLLAYILSARLLGAWSARGERAARAGRLRARGVSGSGGADAVTRLRALPNDASSPMVSWNCCTRSTSSSSFSISSSICCLKFYIYIAFELGLFIWIYYGPTRREFTTNNK